MVFKILFHPILKIVKIVSLLSYLVGLNIQLPGVGFLG
jgi:hypothetical protein